MEFQAAIVAPTHASPLAWCFVFHQQELLLPADGTALAATPLEPWLQASAAAPATAQFLGSLGGHDCWVLQVQQAPAGWQPQPLRQAMMQLPDPLRSLAGRAAQLLTWERAHRFCGACGHATEQLAHERAKRCPACGEVAYPRISPAMMALVWRGQEILLARAPRYAPGVYSALAGFVEAGESVEECVHREVAEEVGVRVQDLRYYASQSWPFPHSLMLAFQAMWASGEIVPQESEIEDARWFHIDKLPGLPPRFSVAGYLIRDTVEALRSGTLV